MQQCIYSQSEDLMSKNILKIDDLNGYKPLSSRSDIKHILFSNLMKVLLVYNPNIKSPQCTLSLKIPTDEDPIEYPGLGVSTCYSIFYGSKNFSREECFANFAEINKLETFIYGKHKEKVFSFKCDKDKFGDALDRFLDSFASPILDDKAYFLSFPAIRNELLDPEKKSRVAIQKIKDQLCKQENWDNLSRFVKNLEYVEKLKVNVLKHYWKNNFFSNRIALVVYSNLPHKTVIEAIDKRQFLSSPSFNYENNTKIDHPRDVENFMYNFINLEKSGFKYKPKLDDKNTDSASATLKAKKSDVKLFCIDLTVKKNEFYNVKNTLDFYKIQLSKISNNSLFEVLHKDGLIDNYEVSVNENDSNYVLTLLFFLTDKGVQNHSSVLSKSREYIKFIDISRTSIINHLRTMHYHYDYAGDKNMFDLLSCSLDVFHSNTNPKTLLKSIFINLFDLEKILEAEDPKGFIRSLYEEACEIERTLGDSDPKFLLQSMLLESEDPIDICKIVDPAVWDKQMQLSPFDFEEAIAKKDLRTLLSSFYFYSFVLHKAVRETKEQLIDYSKWLIILESPASLNLKKQKVKGLVNCNAYRKPKINDPAQSEFTTVPSLSKRFTDLVKNKPKNHIYSNHFNYVSRQHKKGTVAVLTGPMNAECLYDCQCGITFYEFDNYKIFVRTYCFFSVAMSEFKKEYDNFLRITSCTMQLNIRGVSFDIKIWCKSSNTIEVVRIFNKFIRQFEKPKNIDLNKIKEALVNQITIVNESNRFLSLLDLYDLGYYHVTQEEAFQVISDLCIQDIEIADNYRLSVTGYGNTSHSDLFRALFLLQPLEASEPKNEKSFLNLPDFYHSNWLVSCFKFRFCIDKSVYPEVSELKSLNSKLAFAVSLFLTTKAISKILSPYKKCLYPNIIEFDMFLQIRFDSVFMCYLFEQDYNRTQTTQKISIPRFLGCLKKKLDSCADDELVEALRECTHKLLNEYSEFSEFFNFLKTLFISDDFDIRDCQMALETASSYMNLENLKGIYKIHFETSIINYLSN